MTEITEQDKAYYAALLDGEGNIHYIDSNGMYPKPRVRIYNNYAPVLLEGMTKWGGNVRVHTTPNTKVWELSTVTAFNFLQDVYPYLRIKKEEAKWAIILGDNAGKAGHRLSEKEKLVRTFAAGKLDEAFSDRKIEESKSLEKYLS